MNSKFSEERIYLPLESSRVHRGSTIKSLKELFLGLKVSYFYTALINFTSLVDLNISVLITPNVNIIIVSSCICSV